MLDYARIHPPCIVQHRLQPKVKKTRVQEMNDVGTAHNCIYAYILCTSWYIPSYTPIYFESGWSRLANPFRLGRTLAPGFACSSIMPFVHDGQAPQAGLAAPKRPQPRVDLVDIAAPSSVHCCRIYKYLYDICYEYTGIYLYMYIYIVYTWYIA